MLYDNPHANIVVGLTEQLWLPIQISFEMVRVEDLNRMITVLPAYALAATRNSTKDRNFRNPKGLRCGRKPTERP
jgi:hypothetical protein